MLEYPVKVTQTGDGDYVAILVDLSDGPSGRGVDPYAALDDLSAPAKSALAALLRDGALPQPSPTDDRPVVLFDEASQDRASKLGLMDSPYGRYQQSTMLCYSWTNDVVFPDS